AHPGGEHARRRGRTAPARRPPGRGRARPARGRARRRPRAGRALRAHHLARPARDHPRLRQYPRARHRSRNPATSLAPVKPLPSEYDALLREPNAAVIGTVTPAGEPNTVATWYLWDEGRLIVNMDGGRKRLAWMRENPHISLTVLMEDWSKHISLRGTVTELVGGE